MCCRGVDTAAHLYSNTDPSDQGHAPSSPQKYNVVRVGSSELGLLTIKSNDINTSFRLIIIIFIYNINKKCIYLRDKCLDCVIGTSK